VKAWFFALLVAGSSYASVELFNEKGESSTSLTAKHKLTAGVLVDENGDFFCNAFVAKKRGQFQLATASHCLRDRWMQTPRPRTEFAYQDDNGTTRTVLIDAKPTYMGEVETQNATEGADPIDLALVPLGANADWKAVDWDKPTHSPDGEVTVVFYHHAKGRPESSLSLHAIPCTGTAKLPATRVTVTGADGTTRRLDYFIALTARGQVHDESIGLFLDRCKIPLPPGASGGLIVDSQWQPIALLHTGLTTHHFSVGWQKGGWKQKAELREGDLLKGHYLASDGKAYGPLPGASLFEGRGAPLFLFGAALRLDSAARHVKD
jgi:hypothetical protein